MDPISGLDSVAWAHLEVPPGTIAERMTRLLDHGSFAVRITAAVALAYRTGHSSPDRALGILIDAKRHEPLPDFPPGWRQRAQRG